MVEVEEEAEHALHSRRGSLKIWTDRPAYDPVLYQDVLATLRAQDPIWSWDEIQAYKKKMNTRDVFLLFIGDCAEPLDELEPELVLQKAAFYRSMKELLEQQLNREVLLTGRFLGQMGKSRSAPHDHEGRPSYQGDLFHDHNTRVYDPKRLLKAYRAIVAARRVLLEAGFDEIHASHEAYHLDWELALARGFEQKRYFSSAPFLWVGARRLLGHPHAALLSTHANAWGIKIPHPDALTHRSNALPIVRFGAKTPEEQRQQVKGAGVDRIVLDPMHGISRKVGGKKVRLLDDIFAETERSLVAWGPLIQGLMLESFSAHDLQECTPKGTVQSANALCDPRLNAKQTIGYLNFFAQQYPLNKK